MRSRPLMGLGIACIIGVSAGYLRQFLLAGSILLFVAVFGLIRTEKTVKKYTAVFSVFLFVAFCRTIAVRQEMELFSEGILSVGDKNIVFCGKVLEIKNTEKMFQCQLERDGHKVLCQFKNIPGKQVYRGDVLSVRGKAVAFEKAGNPGQFDELSYASSMDLSVKLTDSEILRIVRPKRSILRLLDKLKTALSAFYKKYFSADHAGVIQAMVLGDKSDFTQELKRYYKENGWLHLVTVSGLHMTFIGMGIYRILREKLRLPEILCESAAVLLTSLYSFLAGFGFSLQRAFIMFMYRTGGRYLGRTPDFPTSVILSAAILLFRHPMALGNSGIWFSYSAVAGLALGGWMEKTAAVRLHMEKSKLRGILLSPLCLQTGILLTTLPITLWISYELPMFGFFYGLWMIPVVSLLIPLLLLSGLLGIIMLSISRRLFFLPVICRGIEEVLTIIHHLPSGTWVFGKPSLVWVTIYIISGLILIFCYCTLEIRCLYKYMAGLTFLISLSGVLFASRPENLLTCLDVGQGDGLCVMTPDGSTVMIDGGSSSVSGCGEYRIIPFLKYFGRRQVDIWFISHSDKDHVSGLEEILKGGMMSVSTLVIPDIQDEALEKLAFLAKKSGCQVLYMSAGMSIKQTDFRFKCLYPCARQSFQDKNEVSLVLEADIRGKVFLFTGDLTPEGEKALLASANIKVCDVLKAAHHGSKYSSTAAFLDTVKPDTALISCGKNNRYGHPGEETLRRFEERKINWGNTACSGALFVNVQHGQVAITTFSENKK